MRRVTAEQLDAAYEGAHDDAFWAVVDDYVRYCCYSVPEYLRDDLIQDVEMAVFTAIGRTAIGRFSRWLNGIIFNLRGSAYRERKYRNPEILESQHGEWRDDGEQVTWTPYDISELSTDLGAVDSDDHPDEHDRSVALALDAVRASLVLPKDIQLFDLVKSGRSLRQAALAMQQTYDATRKRWLRLREKCPHSAENPYVNSREMEDRAA